VAFVLSVGDFPLITDKSRASLHPPPEGRVFTDFFGKKIVTTKHAKITKNKTSCRLKRFFSQITLTGDFFCCSGKARRE